MQKLRKLSCVIAVAALSAAAMSGCSTSEPAPEPASSEVEPAPANVASDVESGIEANFPGGISETSPLFPVTEYEDVSDGTVRVYVQETLTDTGRDEVARHVFNMSGMTSDELSTVVVRDASGKDSNHYR